MFTNCYWNSSCFGISTHLRYWLFVVIFVKIFIEIWCVGYLLIISCSFKYVNFVFGWFFWIRTWFFKKAIILCVYHRFLSQKVLILCNWISIMIIIYDILNNIWFSYKFRIYFAIVINIDVWSNRSTNLRLLPFDKTMNCGFRVRFGICDGRNRCYIDLGSTVHGFIRNVKLTGCRASKAQTCFGRLSLVNMFFCHRSPFYDLILISHNDHWQKSLLDRFWMFTTTN